MMICQFCGNTLDEVDAICLNCGNIGNDLAMDEDNLAESFADDMIDTIEFDAGFEEANDELDLSLRDDLDELVDNVELPQTGLDLTIAEAAKSRDQDATDATEYGAATASDSSDDSATYGIDQRRGILDGKYEHSTVVGYVEVATFQSAPTPTRICPICQGVWYETQTFKCTRCQRLICLRDRDPIQLTTCAECARYRELSVRFTFPDQEPSYCTLTLASHNMREEPWERSINLQFPFASLDPDFASLMQDRNLSDPDLRSQVGAPLFNTIFPTEIWTEIEQDFRHLTQGRPGVQIKIVEPPEPMAQFPWETLYDHDHFLSLSPATPIVRWIEKNGPAFLGQGKKPLNVLVLVGSEAGLLTASQMEVAALNESLLEPVEQSTIKFLPVADSMANAADTRVDTLLRSALQSEHYHILHLMGEFGLHHNSFDNHISLSLNHDSEINLDSLGAWLERSSIQMVVITATLKSGDKTISPLAPELKLADRLMRGSVAAMVASRVPFTLDEAHDFALVLYTAMAHDKPLEAALVDARHALEGIEIQAGTHAWSFPVLFRRPIEGVFLDLLPPEKGAGETERPIDYLRFVEEDVASVDPAEAPKSIDQTFTRLCTHRLQVIVGAPDAWMLPLARQLGRRMVEASPELVVHRFPRYEEPANFLPTIRTLSNAVILYDTHNLAALGDEIQALADLVAHGEELYIVITSSDLTALTPDTTLGDWLKQHPQYLTKLGPQDYEVAGNTILRAILARLLGEARKNGSIDLATESTVLRYADNPQGLLSGRYLELPGQVHRFVFHYLGDSKRITEEAEIKLLLQAMDNVDDERTRWFAEALNESQRVLVMNFALFQGLPTYLLASLYHLVVDQLRSAFHLDLAILPLRAEIQQWSLYVAEVQRTDRRSVGDGFVEFVDQEYQINLLRLLREHYSEWLLQLVPLLGSIVCADLPSSNRHQSWTDDDYRTVRHTVARALGAIALCSPRMLREVAASMAWWINSQWQRVTFDETHSVLQHSTAKQILAVPGRTFQHMLEQDNSPGQLAAILEILHSWWKSDSPRIRWAISSAYGRLAVVVPPQRLAQHILALIHRAQSLRNEAKVSLERLKPANKHTRDLREAELRLKDEEEICRAIAYSMRGFVGRKLSSLHRVFELLAGDPDIRVRINMAIALKKIATMDQPGVYKLLMEWAREGNWWRWWTATSTASLLIETGNLGESQAIILVSALLETPRIIGEQRGQTDLPARVGEDLAWALQAALHPAELPADQSYFTRTLNVLGKLIGTDVRHDDILKYTFRAILHRGQRQETKAADALFAVAKTWVSTDAYNSSAIQRRIALDLYLLAGRARWIETIRVLRLLAKSEDFDYSALNERQADTLPLAHLGVGGIVLQAVRENRRATQESNLPLILPLIREMAMVKEQTVRSLAPFVLSGIADERTQHQVIDTLKSWARGPQVPLQLSAIDAAIQIARNPKFSDNALEVIGTLTNNPHMTVVNYLNEHLPEIVDINLRFGHKLATQLDERISMAKAT